MKRIIALCLTLVLTLTLFGACAKKAPEENTTETAVADPGRILSRTELPVSVHYDRQWAYSGSADTSDSSLIGMLVDALSFVQVEEKSDVATQDYTDIIRLSYADGFVETVEFEGNCWIGHNGLRYEADDLSNVRAVLGNILDAAQEPLSNLPVE